MKKKIFVATLVNIVLCSAFVSYSQNPSMAHKPMSKEDSTALNALVMYPDTIRLDIFEACMYPAAIVNIATLQKNSSTEFATILADKSKEQQEDIYNLTRYPGLVHSLVLGGKKGYEEVKKILLNYPAEIHSTATKYTLDHFETLVKVENLQNQTNDQFEQIIADYSPVTKEAFRELIQLPEIISILNDHLDLTVRVGDRYKRDPQRVIHKADSANLAQTRENAQEVEQWKQSIKDNPEDAADLKSAGEEYAKENGYTQDEINITPSPDYVTTYTCYPYSYWFGYPTWYPYSYWYPYPFWFDCGYYYDAYGNLVIIGMPSYYFTYWYFYYPEHWHHYPHLGNHYVNHYYGPRNSHSRNSSVVHRWVDDNKNYLPHDFIENKAQRVETIRQVGQLHADVQKNFGNKPIDNRQRDEYLQQNATKYPRLTTPKERVKEPNAKTPIQPDYYKEQPTKLPPVKLNNTQQKPAAQPNQQPTPPKYQFNNINKAQDYHKNSWEPTQSRPQPQPAPRPQYTPAPAPQPQHQAPSNPGGSPKRK